MNNATIDGALLAPCTVSEAYAAALAAVRRNTTRVTGLHEAITAAAQMSDGRAVRLLTPYVLDAERDLADARSHLAKVTANAHSA